MFAYLLGHVEGCSGLSPALPSLSHTLSLSHGVTGDPGTKHRPITENIRPTGETFRGQRCNTSLIHHSVCVRLNSSLNQADCGRHKQAGAHYTLVKFEAFAFMTASSPKHSPVFVTYLHQAGCPRTHTRTHCCSVCTQRVFNKSPPD